jgi:hypothetical protein
MDRPQDKPVADIQILIPPTPPHRLESPTCPIRTNNCLSG